MEVIEARVAQAKANLFLLGFFGGSKSAIASLLLLVPPTAGGGGGDWALLPSPPVMASLAALANTPEKERERERCGRIEG